MVKVFLKPSLLKIGKTNNITSKIKIRDKNKVKITFLLKKLLALLFKVIKQLVDNPSKAALPPVTNIAAAPNSEYFLIFFIPPYPEKKKLKAMVVMV